LFEEVAMRKTWPRLPSEAQTLKLGRGSDEKRRSREELRGNARRKMAYNEKSRRLGGGKLNKQRVEEIREEEIARREGKGGNKRGKPGPTNSRSKRIFSQQVEASQKGGEEGGPGKTWPRLKWASLNKSNQNMGGVKLVRGGIVSPDHRKYRAGREKRLDESTRGPEENREHNGRGGGEGGQESVGSTNPQPNIKRKRLKP